MKSFLDTQNDQNDYNNYTYVLSNSNTISNQDVLFQDSEILSMQVKDFIQLVKKINPLISIGLETFIQQNDQTLKSCIKDNTKETDEESDLIFSKVISPEKSFIPLNITLDEE